MYSTIEEAYGDSYFDSRDLPLPASSRSDARSRKRSSSSSNNSVACGTDNRKRLLPRQSSTLTRQAPNQPHSEQRGGGTVSTSAARVPPSQLDDDDDDMQMFHSFEEVNGPFATKSFASPLLSDITEPRYVYASDGNESSSTERIQSKDDPQMTESGPRRRQVQEDNRELLQEMIDKIDKLLLLCSSREQSEEIKKKTQDPPTMPTHSMSSTKNDLSSFDESGSSNIRLLLAIGVLLILLLEILFYVVRKTW